MTTSHHPDNNHTNPSYHPFRNDLEAYALGALEPEERFLLETHLDDCAECRALLDEFRMVMDLLPYSAEPADPSDTAKASLMKRIANDKPQGETTVRAVSNPWQAAAETEGDFGTPTLSSWQRWIAPAFVAPLAIVLIVMSAWTHSLQNDVDELREANQPPTLVNTSGQQGLDLQLYDFKPACPECKEQRASGQLGGNPNSSVGVVVVWDLDPNEKHQVWCINKQGEKMLVSDLEVENNGNVIQAIAFPQELGGYDQIYVARHDGSTEPDAELLVAMNEEHESDEPIEEDDPQSS